MVNNWLAFNLITTGTLFGLGGGSCSKSPLSNEPKFKVGDCVVQTEKFDEFSIGFKSKILKVGKKQYLIEIARIGSKSNGATMTDLIEWTDERYKLSDCKEFE